MQIKDVYYLTNMFWLCLHQGAMNSSIAPTFSITPVGNRTCTITSRVIITISVESQDNKPIEISMTRLSKQRPRCTSLRRSTRSRRTSESCWSRFVALEMPAKSSWSSATPSKVRGGETFYPVVWLRRYTAAGRWTCCDSIFLYVFHWCLGW